MAGLQPADLPGSPENLSERRTVQFIALAGLAPAIATHGDPDGDSAQYHLAVENEPFQALHLEICPGIDGKKVLVFTHYQRVNGELGTDTQMIYVLSTDGKLELVDCSFLGPSGPIRGKNVRIAEMMSDHLLGTGYAEKAREKLEV